MTETTTFALFFRVRLTEIGQQCSHQTGFLVRLGSRYIKMRLKPWLGRKRMWSIYIDHTRFLGSKYIKNTFSTANAFLVYLEHIERVWSLQMIMSFTRWELIIALP